VRQGDISGTTTSVWVEHLQMILQGTVAHSGQYQYRTHPVSNTNVGHTS